MDVFTFANTRPWFTFFLGFWALLIIAFVAVAFRTIFTSLNIALRGWPPAHLNAQGDFKEEKKEDKKEAKPVDLTHLNS